MDIPPGGDEAVNLALAHMICNSRKNNLVVVEALDKLKSNIEAREDGWEQALSILEGLALSLIPKVSVSSHMPLETV